MGAILLGAWTARPHPLWLAGAALALVAAVVSPRPPRRGRARPFGLLLLLAAVPTGLFSHHRVAGIRSDFDAYWEAREARVFADLQDALDGVLDRSEAAVEALARAADDAGGAPSPEVVASIRSAHGLSAAAVYGPPGGGSVREGDSPPLLAGDGVHRGRVPETVQEGARPYMFGHQPLFSYLYVTRPVEAEGGTAVVAALVAADLPDDVGVGVGDVLSGVGRRNGETVRLRMSPGNGAVAFDFVSASDTLFSVALERPVAAVRAADVETRWLRAVVALLGLGWLALTVAGRRDGRHARRAAATVLAVVALVPLERLAGPAWAFGPDAGLIAGPFGPSPGRWAALVAVGLAVSPLLWTPRSPRRRWWPLVGMAVALPLLGLLLGSASSASLVAGVEGDWVVWQATVALTFSLVAIGTLVRASGEAAESPATLVPGAGALVGALAVALGLAVIGGVWARVQGSLPVAFTALWVAAVPLAVAGASRWTGWRRSALLWTMGAVLGGSAAFPVAWAIRTEARMDVAEARLARLGTRPDPYLHYLLGQLAARVGALDAGGAPPLETLYRGWIDSGLAQEGTPLWLSLHGAGGLPGEELRLGVPRNQPSAAGEFLEAARAADSVQILRFQRPDAHYVATVPLSGGRMLTAVVPPLRRVLPTTSAGPLFGRLFESVDDPLTLVPLDGPDEGPGPAEVTWVRTPDGWRGETGLSLPEGPSHAHYRLEVAGPLLVTARATLLLGLTVVLVMGLWGAGRVVFLGAVPAASQWRRLLGSFRARLTLALFSFFLLAIAVFGALAYATVSGTAERAARVLAERVGADVAGFYLEEGNMALLAQRVDADLLEYRAGELREGSPSELVDLGLYEGWLPQDVWRLISAREEILATRGRTLGRRDYLVAYRLLPDGDVLGIPVPREAGATAVRRREVLQFLGFAVVMGAFLSFLLARLVARTLSRPIQALQGASERVGGGNLEVRLPADRTDEFGSVFGSFNGMVRRLRRERGDLVRTTRRTQAIVDDAATGVLALDSTGRVTLANPRAERLLGIDVEVGRALREIGVPADEFVRWVKQYFRDGLREAGTEFQFGERRLRVRARRISRQDPVGGAVLSVEDVTDELRAERILAWGEMARQIAHEVKNPLTPIKLSIQHIRRAWEDRRSDFSDILDRNAEAALGEIDRLATIASSFSRFGAPTTADEGPLEPVDLRAVLSEVIALYSSGGGAIHFEMDAPDDLPPVAARATEVKEVLVNLLENARAAIEVEGEVRVSAVAMEDDVVLRVVDDGPGIPEELLPRVFEPHFSTRSTGTGLGLAIVQRLVESWGASVSVEGRDGGGTAAEIRLRRWDDAGEPGAPGSEVLGPGPVAPDSPP